MRVGFVILNYNSWEMAGDLAQKVASYYNIDAVVVVDNFSTDDSYGYLKRIHNRKIYITQSRKNGGYSYGNNHGAKICGELGMNIVFFANPDIFIEASHIQKILERFSHTDYSVLSGIEYDADGRTVQPLLWRRRGIGMILGIVFSWAGGPSEKRCLDWGWIKVRLYNVWRW